MYRTGIEGILGLTLQRGALRIDPCIPRSWPGFEAVLKRSGTTYHIVVQNPQGLGRGPASLEVDGQKLEGNTLSLVNDGAVHEVLLVIGPA